MSNLVGGSKEPTDYKRYKSKVDGLYYNGYLMSPECAEEAFGPACRKMARLIEADVNKLAESRKK